MLLARDSALALFLICSSIYEQEHTVNIQWLSTLWAWHRHFARTWQHDRANRPCRGAKPRRRDGRTAPAHAPDGGAAQTPALRLGDNRFPPARPPPRLRRPA